MSQNVVAKEFAQCNKCGLCRVNCAVAKELLLEKFTPRGKIQLARLHSEGVLDISERYRDIFARCLLCGSCSVTCPSGVDLNAVFLHMRAVIAQNDGVHPGAQPAVASLLENHNISGEDNLERGDWRDFIKNLPGHRYERKRAEIIYFVGCVASFFPMVQKIPQNVVKILEASGADFAVLGGDEWCCGFPFIGAGLPDKAREMMDHNVKKVRELKAKTVLFSCPSCCRTWKDFHPQDLALYHDTQWISKLIAEGKIELREVDRVVTYHDPCDLGRKGGEYDAPRDILRAIPGVSLVELENNRSQTICCGGGGNLEMTDPGLSADLAYRKIREIRSSGADTVVTSCQQCIRTIKGAARRHKVDLDVLDVTDVVMQALLPEESPCAP
jgi:heterodisulfide reductase subunit D